MSSKKNQTNALKAEDVVQAVLLGDSYNELLAPYCLTTPLSLMPLVNAPLLDYALEYLETAGVHECFIYLSKSPEEVKEYLSQSGWLAEDRPMTVHVQTAEDCLSLGDVMRDLDAKSLIQSDFLLMSVDCVTNIDVVPILKAHSARRKSEDRGMVLTLVCRAAAPGHAVRQGEPQLLVAADAETGRLLHHQRLPREGRGSAAVPLSVFQQQAAVEIRYDLLDPGLCVCAPTVPQLFADNFDFQTRDHFIRGILVNEEIMGNTIYCKFLDGDVYAASISGLSSLQNITRDVLERWAHPVVPEARPPARSQLRCLQRNVYRHRTATVASGSRLEECVSLGAGATVGVGCRLLRAVVGAGCHIGDSVVLEDAVLDPGCRLGDRVRVTKSVLGRDVHLAHDVVLEPGCVLGSGVRVEALRTLPAGTLLTTKMPDDGFGDGPADQSPDVELVGEGGCGFRYTPEEADDELLPAPLGGNTVESEEEESSESELSSEEGDEEDEEGGGGAESPPLDDTRLFYNEVLDSLVRGFHEKIRPENLILEINSSKFAYNVTVEELNSLVVKAILSVPEHGREAALPPAAFLAQLQPVLAAFLPLLSNYIRNPEAERSCLRSIEAFAVQHGSLSACLAKVLMLLYQRDVLSETAILSWHADDADQTPESGQVRKQVQKLVEWLQEADEESDSDDSED